MSMIITESISRIARGTLDERDHNEKDFRSIVQSSNSQWTICTSCLSSRLSGSSQQSSQATLNGQSIQVV